MKRLIALAALTLLSACQNPNFGLGLNIGPNGTTITPSLSGQIGGANVSITG